MKPLSAISLRHIPFARFQFRNHSCVDLLFAFASIFDLFTRLRQKEKSPCGSFSFGLQRWRESKGVEKQFGELFCEPQGSERKGASVRSKAASLESERRFPRGPCKTQFCGVVRLRQIRSNFCLPKVTSFFIQAAGLVYHHAPACISSP